MSLRITPQVQRDLYAYTARIRNARAAYYAHTTTRCHDCSETAEPGLTRCQSHRWLVAVREANRRKKEKTK